MSVVRDGRTSLTKAEGVELVQSAEEKGPGRPDCGLPVFGGAYKKGEERVLFFI